MSGPTFTNWRAIEEDEGLFYAVSDSERVGPYATRSEARKQAKVENENERAAYMSKLPAATFKAVWTIDGKATHALVGSGLRNGDKRSCCGINVWYTVDYRRPDFKLGEQGNCRNCERVILAREPCELGHGEPGEYGRPSAPSEVADEDSATG